MPAQRRGRPAVQCATAGGGCLGERRAAAREAQHVRDGVTVLEAGDHRGRGAVRRGDGGEIGGRGLRARDGTFGLVTMCVGGGQGMALIVERLS